MPQGTARQQAVTQRASAEQTGARGAVAPASQTLSRGIRILEILGDAGKALTIDEVTRRLEVHRSVAYRLVRTLEDHGLVTRTDAGLLELGARLAALAAGVSQDLQSEALPELTAVANELGMTCFLVVLDRDECVTLVSVEPRHAVASVAQRPGSRHPVGIGAPGKAILAMLPRSQWPTSVPAEAEQQVKDAVAAGFTASHDEVIANLHAVAVPLPLRGRAPAAIAVVSLADQRPAAELAGRLQVAATAIRESLGG
ncbi:IclR family transcriptional regulator [Humibacter ginsenosidimutans]|uniref:Helix-turn-helix domain-containing protein n=1 Tax=Humibacter ginsenosidimutans TaxID=2599293 RepID=A0A5B8M5T2_9MICO|nr:helix-turn-helix domain-containing protein [Humibacter ginsenosidimutans]QDZ15616.1 helix-turn-helix domain-containing protein [Humibacter ginsenosidimutans]